MKINYIKNKDIDKKKWNKCVYEANNTYLYGFSWFLDIIAVQWDALILGDYEAVMPLTKKKKYLVQYLYQPVFIQKINIYTSMVYNQNIYEKFLNAIPKKYVSIDIHLDTLNPKLQNDYELMEYANYELTLNKSYKELYSNFRRNTKRNIKKALSNNIIVKKEDDFTNFLKTRKDRAIKRGAKNINEYHYSRLEELLIYLQKNNSLVTYNAYNHEGEFCASSCYYISKNRATISHTATQFGLNNKANFLTVNKFIEDYASNNIILDLAGSNLEGVAYFNSGFGAINKPYSRICKNNNNVVKMVRDIKNKRFK